MYISGLKLISSSKIVSFPNFRCCFRHDIGKLRNREVFVRLKGAIKKLYHIILEMKQRANKRERMNHKISKNLRCLLSRSHKIIVVLPPPPILLWLLGPHILFGYCEGTYFRGTNKNLYSLRWTTAVLQFIETLCSTFSPVPNASQLTDGSLLELTIGTSEKVSSTTPQKRASRNITYLCGTESSS